MIEADVVEDEELRFGAEIRRIGKAAVLEVDLGLLGNPPRIAIVVLPRNRIDDVSVMTSVGTSANGSITAVGRRESEACRSH